MHMNSDRALFLIVGLLLAAAIVVAAFILRGTW